MRTEEDAGRQELVLAGAVGRGAAFVAQLVAIAVGTAVLWLATFAGLVVARLPVGGSAYLALASVSVVPGLRRRRRRREPGRADAAARARNRQRRARGRVRPPRRRGHVVASRLAALGNAARLDRGAARVRVSRDRRSLLLPAATAALLLGLAAAIALRRDIGAGLFHAHDSAPPSDRLLGSPTQQALRAERGMLAAWLLGIGGFAFVLGVISDSISAAGISKTLQQQLEKLGLASITTPAGYLAFTFLFFIFAISLFGCSQVAAARREEADQQLETLLALPVGRRRWLAGTARARRRARRRCSRSSPACSRGPARRRRGRASRSPAC